MTLDEAWRELEMDALASDGPIRDSDVKDAIKRNRRRIEKQAAAEARRELLAKVEGLRIDERSSGHMKNGYYRCQGDVLALLDPSR